jgi:CheY-like chemotaxis protein
MKKLVYVVEDNLVQQKMLQVHFEQMLGDYSVKVFSDPEDMMTHIQEKPFAIVLDHFFSEKIKKTGLDYLKDIRKKHGSQPVIYYTSSEDAALRDQVLKLGVEDFIIKNSASLVKLRTTLDLLNEKKSKKGLFKRLLRK